MATAAFTTVIDRSTGEQFTEAIYDDMLKDNMNQLAGAHRNLLTNGGFEVWQRGVGPFTTTATYGPDRWLLTVASTTMTVTKETTTVDAGSAASAKIVNTGVGTNVLTQRVEDVAGLRGRTISLSVRVHQSVASVTTLRITQSGVTISTSAASATTGSFVTLTLTVAVDAAATSLDIAILTSTTTGSTVYVDNAMLVIGPAPAPYQPLHPQEDLARCQRYYQVFHGYAAGGPNLASYGAAGANNGMPYLFPVTPGGTPTVTKNGTWAVTNCGQPTIGTIDRSGVTIYATVTALGSFSFGPNSTDDQVTIEYNP